MDFTFIRKQVFFFQKCISGRNGSNDKANLKSENKFVQQNCKLVLECGFRFSVRESEQTGLLYQNHENSGVWDQIPRNRFFCLACSDACRENLKPHFNTNFQFCYSNPFSDFSFAWSFEPFLPKMHFWKKNTCFRIKVTAWQPHQQHWMKECWKMLVALPFSHLISPNLSTRTPKS